MTKLPYLRRRYGDKQAYHSPSVHKQGSKQS